MRRRRLAALASLPAAAGLAGCSVFAAPNVASAPLRASLAAEALYAGPLREQPKELSRLGTRCGAADRDPAAACRFPELASPEAAPGRPLLEPSEGGAGLRAPWVRWTQLYRAWDAAFGQERALASLVWPEGEQGDYTPLFDAFRRLETAARLGVVTEREQLRHELFERSRAVLAGRIRALAERYRAAPDGEKAGLERQIRGYLELLAAAGQRADERVRRLETLAEEEARFYATLGEATRTLDGLQRNITNHFLKVDLVLSADEARALVEAARERLGRIREAVDAGRKAELEAQQKAATPEWAERLREALEAVRGARGAP